METTVSSSDNIGSVISVIFSATDGIEIFGLSLTAWLAIIIVLSAIGMILKGVKNN